MAPAAHSDGLTGNSNESSCTDRVAIVTGGSRGIGREVVRKLARRGYAVVVGYIRDQDAADTIVDEVLAGRGRALTMRADVADELDVERLFAETANAFGGVDVVVHAAGHNVVGPAAGDDLGRFDALQRTIVRGTFVVVRHAAGRVRDGGAIVNLSGAAVGSVLPTDAASAASDAAVGAMMRVFGCDLRDRDITVNAVAPAWDGACGAAAIADVVAFLVGSNGRSVNGRVIQVDCGEPITGWGR
jgi:3-oxoacyl-[acyl-carrier protein] reductase